MKRVDGVWLVAGLGLCGVACGPQKLDLLVRATEEDSCVAFVSERECHDNAALGCSFQPNAEGCRSDDPSCQPGMCRGGDPFVRRVERSFFLNGEPFRFAGVSSWALLQPAACATVKADQRESWVERAYDDLVPGRAKVARFFAFQNSAGASGTDFTLFDAAVRGARRAGVRLQLVLDVEGAGCSQGDKRDEAWYQTGYQNLDGNYALSYRDFAESVARRYRDEPTVLGYILLQGLSNGETGTLSAFVTEMGQRLHGLAPSQLLSIDLSFPRPNDPEGAAFRELQELPVVDFIDIDDYTFDYPPKPLDPTLLDVLHAIDKPATIGEGAFNLEGGDAAALFARGEAAKGRLVEWKNWGFSGALLWAYQPGWSEVSEEFDARPGDPILQPGGVLADAPW